MDNFEDIYETMIGVRTIDGSVPGIANAFAEGQLCDVEYGKMRAAYERLCDRLGVVDEDDDLNIMVDAMEKIQKELCRRFCFLQDDDIACTCCEHYK